MLTQHPNNQSVSPDARLVELDALRGLAALSVVLFHFTINDNAKLLGWEFSYGVTGVDIFFMISGFVIFLTVMKIRRWQDFVVSRFARLYPAFWYCMFITLGFTVFSEPDFVSPFRIFANATMMPVYFGIEDLDGSYWTLLVEIIFYLWILVLFITNNIRNINKIGFITILSMMLFHQFSAYYVDFYEFTVKKVQLLNHFPLFFSGILFYQLKKGEKRTENIALLVFSLIASFYLHHKGGRSQFHISATAHYLLLTSFHLLFGLFIMGKLSFLKFGPLLFLGKISYCLYLIHQYVGLHLISAFTDKLHLNIYIALFLAFSICIAIAYLVNTFIEIPANRLIRGWYSSNEAEIFGREGRKVAMR
ncbi:MAG: acyltransferase [Dyadobacter sp.]|uniref:acyltransferase family protein n=1 Tax=Dyadobacter sp. TaxID=1914288 RepID=UPI003263D603